MQIQCSILKRLKTTGRPVHLIIEVLIDSVQAAMRYILLEHNKNYVIWWTYLCFYWFQALLSASNILCTGFDRLKRAQESITRRTNPDFHGELMRLRQHWRLKKFGKSILGDLSYKSGNLKSFNEFSPLFHVNLKNILRSGESSSSLEPNPKGCYKFEVLVNS